MPARAGDNGDTRLDDSAVKVSQKTLSNASSNYFEPAAGLGGAKRGAITMKIFVRDGMLVNHAVIVPPP